jgi:hypothetical protein
MANERTESARAKEGNGQPGTAGSGAGPTAGSAAASGPAQPQIRIDTSNLKSTYCNVCNGTSTREEMVLTFGVNQDWDLGPQMREIHLHHRIILSPYAAKRLQELITKLVQDHEARYGALKTA